MTALAGLFHPSLVHHVARYLVARGTFDSLRALGVPALGLVVLGLLALVVFRRRGSRRLRPGGWSRRGY